MTRSRRWSFPRVAVARLCLLVIVVATVSMGMAGGAAAQAVTLAWQYRPGETLEYLQTVSSRSVTPMGDMEQKQSIRMSQEVLRVAPDGTADLRMTYTALRLETDGPMGRQEYDSERGDQPADAGMRMMARMVGTSFEATIASDGSVLSVAGLDEVVDRMVEAMAEDSPGAEAETRAMLDQMFGEDRFMAQLQQGVHALPSTPLEPGAEWSTDLELYLPFGVVRSDYTYRLEEVASRDGSRVAVISITGTMGPFELEEDSPMAGVMELSGGAVTGAVEFDVDRGLLVRTTATTVMELSTMGMTLQVETTHTMELLDD
jgi:hypothetical protein